MVKETQGRPEETMIDETFKKCPMGCKDRFQTFFQAKASCLKVLTIVPIIILNSLLWKWQDEISFDYQKRTEKRREEIDTT